MKFFRRESGQTVIVFALLFVAIMGFAAVAIDIASEYEQCTNMQTAADTSVLAAVQMLIDGGTEAEAETSLKNNLMANGDIPSSDIVSDDVSCPV